MIRLVKSDVQIGTSDMESETSRTSFSSGESDDKYQRQGEILCLEPYQFEPVINVVSSESDDELC